MPRLIVDQGRLLAIMENEAGLEPAKKRDLQSRAFPFCHSFVWYTGMDLNHRILVRET